jgi:hypothetical protein
VSNAEKIDKDGEEEKIETEMEKNRSGERNQKERQIGRKIETERERDQRETTQNLRLLRQSFSGGFSSYFIIAL